MTAQQLLQERIDAEQRVDTLVYGMRSIKTCGGTLHCTGPHARQLVAAQYEAARVLRDDETQWAAMDAGWIQVALGKARAALKDAKAALKDVGGKRQLRLALAAGDEVRELALAA